MVLTLNVELQHIDSIELQELITYLTVILNRQILETERINNSKKGKSRGAEKKPEILTQLN